MPDRTKRIPDDVREAMKSGTITAPHFFKMPQLDRKLYLRVNDVLSALGGTWNSKHSSHIFTGNINEIIDQAINLGVYTKFDCNPFDYYPTPAPLVDMLIDAAEIEDGMTILEPEAGEGHVAVRLYERFPGSPLTAIEIDPRRAELLAPKIPPHPVYRMDFLNYNHLIGTGRPERIVMNPPFGKRLDVYHSLHAYSVLAKGGKMSAIISVGFEYYKMEGAKELRRLTNYHGSVKHLPEGSFRSDGTEVETVLITLEK